VLVRQRDLDAAVAAAAATTAPPPPEQLKLATA
jgi:hypothetical protein